MSAFDAALDFTLKWEGGFSLDPADSGNWTGGAINSGELKGTKYGISAAAYPWMADKIKDLTVGEAAEIYRRDYWIPLKHPSNVAVPVGVVTFDAAVQHGVARTRKWWGETGDVQTFMVARMDFYLSLGAFDRYGRGWMRRMTDLYRYLNDLRDATGAWQVPAERFFLVTMGMTIPLPLAKAAVVGDKLYVRLGRTEGS